ncbi:MAG TPA: hypothetical protein ENK21_04840 [Trueperaceae bacterium]|nr:hypothetical protein [Trueperaceae bacterium]
MKNKTFISLIALLATAIVLSACNPAAKTSVLELQATGLAALENGSHYEGWAIVDGKALSTGKFNVQNGNIISLAGAKVKQFKLNFDISKATKLVITIEPKGDTDAKPAATHILAGTVSNGKSSLTIADSAALGNDFTTAAGKYILATPTTSTKTDENSGIWFLNIGKNGPEVGLNLPTLPAGWVYEGWTVINGIPVSSGKFSKVDAIDASAVYSNPANSGPPFPGEDYVLNAPKGLSFPTNIAGGKAVISIEPAMDDSPKPFALKPLVGDIPANATDHKAYSMGQNLNFPTISAVIK